MRQALISSVIGHAALAIGFLSWLAFGATKDGPGQVFSVDLVQVVPAANAPATASVEFVPPTLAPVKASNEAEERDPRPDPPTEKLQPERTALDLASTEILDADARADSESVDWVVPRVTSGAKDGRFAIDAPAEYSPTREPGLVGIDGSEVRGSPVPLRMTKPDSYSRSYVILHAVEPKYPKHEIERGIEGNVTVELVVDELGQVENVNVIDLVGPESFRASALEAVRQFKFQPQIENGVPSAMWIKFLIKFRING